MLLPLLISVKLADEEPRRPLMPLENTPFIFFNAYELSLSLIPPAWKFVSRGALAVSECTYSGAVEDGLWPLKGSEEEEEEGSS